MSVIAPVLLQRAIKASTLFLFSFFCLIWSPAIQASEISFDHQFALPDGFSSLLGQAGFIKGRLTSKPYPDDNEVMSRFQKNKAQGHKAVPPAHHPPQNTTITAGTSHSVLPPGLAEQLNQMLYSDFTMNMEDGTIFTSQESMFEQSDIATRPSLYYDNSFEPVHTFSTETAIASSFHLPDGQFIWPLSVNLICSCGPYYASGLHSGQGQAILDAEKGHFSLTANIDENISGDLSIRLSSLLNRQDLDEVSVIDESTELAVKFPGMDIEQVFQAELLLHLTGNQFQDISGIFLIMLTLTSRPQKKRAFWVNFPVSLCNRLSENYDSKRVRTQLELLTG